MTFPQEVALVVGASRGIGRQIAIDLARNNYKGRFSTFVVAAKTISDSSLTSPLPPDPNSPHSTINTVAQEITSLGYAATAFPVDTRSYSSIQSLVDKTMKQYKRLDVLIYNSGAIWWASVEKTPMKRFQLMQRVNAEGFYGCVQACLPCFAENGWQGRIVVVCPPIYERFFRGKTAYAMGKVGMSVLVKGLYERFALLSQITIFYPFRQTADFEIPQAMDFKREGRTGMAVTGIWPASAIESAATAPITAKDPTEAQDLRKPTIFSDSILAMLQAPTTNINGQLELDEDFLRQNLGVRDFSKYSVVKGATPRRIMPRRFPDLRVDEHDDEGKRVDSAELRKEKL